jgi:hypothetical protein
MMGGTHICWIPSDENWIIFNGAILNFKMLGGLSMFAGVTSIMPSPFFSQQFVIVSRGVV